MPLRFSDETTSGQWDPRLRGLRRVTFLARAEDGGDSPWLRYLYTKLPGHAVEPKSARLMALMLDSPEARRAVLRNIASYSVVVVNLHAYREEVLGKLVDQLRPIIPPGQDPFEFVLQLPRTGSRAQALLRQFILQASVIGHLEGFFRWASDPYGLEAELGKYGMGGRPAPDLTSDTKVYALDERALTAYLARLASAVGDILSPQRQADAIMALVSGWQGLASPFLAVQQLTWGVDHDRIFDEGSKPVWDELEEANERVVTFLDDRAAQGLRLAVRPGILEERSSQLELGLQAADVAARIAAHAYETAETDVPLERARALQAIFAAVSYNGSWL